MQVVALAGGVGAARFLRGLAMAMDPADITVIGNTGDDEIMYGLHVCPDLDIVTYTLAGIVDDAGWGIAGDTTHALDQMALYGVDTWFKLRDRDIGTNMARTMWLGHGIALADITDQIRRGLGVASRIIPMSNEPVSTRIVTTGGEVLAFQEYFVKNRFSDPVAEVHFAGAASALPAPGVLEAIDAADLVIICPSNPVLSIGPILEVPGIHEALVERREDVVAISPLVGGAALKGPAAELMPVVGASADAVGVAEVYKEFCSLLVIDTVDEALAPGIEELNIEAVVTGTIMSSPEEAARLAREVLDL